MRYRGTDAEERKPIVKHSRVLMLALYLGTCSSAWAEIVAPDLNDLEAVCGDKIKKGDVLVLDLESFGQRTELALKFVDEHAGEHQLVSTEPEVIVTKGANAWYRRKSGIKRAQKEAAKRGCDLMLVLEAGTNIEDIEYRTRGTSYGGSYSESTNSTVTKSGYAVVLMGNRSEKN